MEKKDAALLALLGVAMAGGFLD